MIQDKRITGTGSRQAAMAAVATALVFCAGCHPAFEAHVRTSDAWVVDDQREVHVARESRVCALNDAHNQHELCWYMTDTEDDACRPVWKGVVGRWTATDESSPPGLRDIEVRADTDRSRLWLVDRSTGTVLASADTASGAITAAADPQPPWADPEAGERLIARDVD